MCVGFWILKEFGERESRNKEFARKIGDELRFCMERKGNKGSNRNVESKLSPIEKLFCKIFRMFFIIEQSESRNIIHRLNFYPNIQFNLKLIKLKPQKITENDVYEGIMKGKYVKNSYGFMTQTVNGSLTLFDKNNPKVNRSILVGFWIDGDLNATSKSK